MRFTVVSPVHEAAAPFLARAYRSLCAQTFGDWEWVVGPNGGAAVPEEIARDERVIVQPIEDGEGEYNRVGRIKREACRGGTGEAVVELDPDDILTPDCLEHLARAFEEEEAQYVYSNSAEFRWPGWESEAYSRWWGWEHRAFPWTDEGGESHTLQEMVAWPVGPQMLRRIEWSPNHVRAWRREAYEEVGGHNPELALGDDHELSIRFYLKYGARGFRHIDRCLYLYRVHGGNSCRLWNDEVQAQSWANYVKYLFPLAEVWAGENGLALLDLGGGIDSPEGYTAVDVRGGDVTADLERRWPFEDGSVGVLRAFDVIEHLRDPVHTMNEAYRVLAPGAFFFIRVPSTDGRGAFQDPTHVSFWNANSFWYYTDESKAKYIRPQCRARFQVARVVDYFPTEWHKENRIPYVGADLICLKPPYDRRPVGEVLI